MHPHRVQHGLLHGPSLEQVQLFISEPFRRETLQWPRLAALVARFPHVLNKVRLDCW